MQSPPSHYEEALRFLYSFHRPAPPPPRRGEVVFELASKLGALSAINSRRIAQVTGTNGKGSTCVYLELFARSKGYSTICLTSPHLNTIRERIRIDGSPISQDEFVQHLARAAPALECLRDTSLHPRPASIVVLLALLAHERRGAEWLGIYEVGLGGLNDSTNVFNRSTVALTQVAEDHLSQCGGTLEALLLEKLGLCRPGGTVVHQIQRPKLQLLLDESASRMRLAMSPVSITDTMAMGACMPGVLMDGRYQAANAALAHRTGMALGILPAELDRLAASVSAKRAFIPGRLERRQVGDRAVVLDGAHNVPAISCLIDHLRSVPIQGSRVAILGISADKDWQAIVGKVTESRLFSNIILTRSTRPRGLDPQHLASAIPAGLRWQVTLTLRSALKCALTLDAREVVIFGSLALVADFERTLYSLDLDEWAMPAHDIDPVQPWMRPLA